jgi:hypothetical protein
VFHSSPAAQGIMAKKVTAAPTSFAVSLPPSVIPSMAAGVTDKLWEMSDMVKVLEDWEVAN